MVRTSKSTKKSAAVCKVPTKARKPSRKQYETKRAKLDDGSLLFALDAASGYNSPHEWPPYGGKCYIQAYAEMKTWEMLCYTAARYTQALSSGVSPEILAMLAQKYMEALVAYNDAWMAMDICLNGIVV